MPDNEHQIPLVAPGDRTNPRVSIRIANEEPGDPKQFIRTFAVNFSATLDTLSQQYARIRWFYADDIQALKDIVKPAHLDRLLSKEPFAVMDDMRAIHHAITQRLHDIKFSRFSRVTGGSELFKDKITLSLNQFIQDYSTHAQRYMDQSRRQQESDHRAQLRQNDQLHTAMLTRVRASDTTALQAEKSKHQGSQKKMGIAHHKIVQDLRTQQAHALEAQATRYSNDLHGLNKQVHDLRTENGNLKKSRRAVATTARQQQQGNKQLSTDNQHLQAENSRIQAVNKQIQATLADPDSSDLAEKIISSEQEKQTLKHTIDTMEEENTQLRQETNQLRQRIDQVQSKFDRWQQAEQKKEAKQEKAHAELKKQNEQLTQEVQALKQKNQAEIDRRYNTQARQQLKRTTNGLTSPVKHTRQGHNIYSFHAVHRSHRCIKQTLRNPDRIDATKAQSN